MYLLYINALLCVFSFRTIRFIRESVRAPADGMGKKAMTNEQNEFLNVEHLSKSNVYISADCLVREINGFQS